MEKLNKTAVGLGLGLGLVAGLIGVSVLNASDAVAANVSLGTASSAQAQLTHGDFQVLGDGGVKLNLCGRTRLVEDGGTISIINGQPPCTAVEPGTNGAAFINFLNGGGLNAWKTDHGL